MPAGKAEARYSGSDPQHRGSTGILTIGFSLLRRVAVVEDSLGVMSPGQAAELDPFQNIRQLLEPVRVQEAQRDPVRPAAAQTVCKVFTFLGQPAH